MKKILKNIHWILVGVLSVVCLILIFSFNVLLRASVSQTHNQQTIEQNFLATQTFFDNRVETLLNELDKAKAARDVYASQLEEAENKLRCSNPDLFKTNYILTDEIGKALADYLSKTEVGEIKTIKHELVWPGLGFRSRTTFYTITMSRGDDDYVHEFIVYHIDAFFSKNRVFSIGRQCWLDG